ncbi:MAG: four helix bundle protein [Patescibacteria group bacterium]|nr:four helix bundle protein [Patescibacteria group bacterium]
MAVVTIHQRTLKFSITITRFLHKIIATPKSHIIRNQLMRSGCSIGANIVEAQHSVTKKEFQRFISIALRSARETEYWLNILKELENNHQPFINNILRENDEISKIIAAIILKSKDGT